MTTSSQHPARQQISTTSADSTGRMLATGLCSLGSTGFNIVGRSCCSHSSRS